MEETKARNLTKIEKFDELAEPAVEVNEENGNFATLNLNDSSISSGKFQCSTSSYDSNLTITPTSDRCLNHILYPCYEFTSNTLEVPIVGYEVMEERARFTVYKLKIDHKTTQRSWYVYRRYTDFIRLSSVIKTTHPAIAALLPRKRWFGNNFDPEFIDARIKGLQVFVNMILKSDTLLEMVPVQDFLCLNDISINSEDFSEDVKNVSESLSETLFHLRNVLEEKNSQIEELSNKLTAEMKLSRELKSFIRNQTVNCDTCVKALNDDMKEIL